jgi:DNA polymerase-3 subunit beta
MKFSVTKEKLLEGLQQVQNVVSTRTTLPILSNVLLQASGNEVHLTTTDLDVGVRGSFEAKVDREGRRRCRASFVHDHPRAAFERDSDRGRWQKRRVDSQRPKLFQDPRFARRRVPPLRSSKARRTSRFRRRRCAMACARRLRDLTDETRYVLNGVCSA